MSIWSSEADLSMGNYSSTVSKGALFYNVVNALNATGLESSFYLYVYAGIGLSQCKLLMLLSNALLDTIAMPSK